MKSLMSYIITTGLFIAIMLFLIAVNPAFADSRCSSDSCPTTPGTPTTYSSESSISNTARTIIITGALVCIGMSIWDRRWCWQDEPLATVEPYDPHKNDITPDQLYIFEVK